MSKIDQELEAFRLHRNDLDNARKAASEADARIAEHEATIKKLRDIRDAELRKARKHLKAMRTFANEIGALAHSVCAGIESQLGTVEGDEDPMPREPHDHEEHAAQ